MIVDGEANDERDCEPYGPEQIAEPPESPQALGLLEKSEQDRGGEQERGPFRRRLGRAEASAVVPEAVLCLSYIYAHATSAHKWT